jgi:hypothetical protein
MRHRRRKAKWLLSVGERLAEDLGPDECLRAKREETVMAILMDDDSLVPHFLFGDLSSGEIR